MSNKINISWINECPVDKCTNKVCLSLNSDKCFPHTEGSRRWKLIKIRYNRLIKKILKNVRK